MTTNMDIEESTPKNTPAGKKFLILSAAITASCFLLYLIALYLGAYCDYCAYLPAIDFLKIKGYALAKTFAFISVAWFILFWPTELLTKLIAYFALATGSHVSYSTEKIYNPMGYFSMGFIGTLIISALNFFLFMLLGWLGFHAANISFLFYGLPTIFSILFFSLRLKYFQQESSAQEILIATFTGVFLGLIVTFLFTSVILSVFSPISPPPTTATGI